MKYSIRKRQNPLNRGESKFYASPAYGEEIDVHTLASDISKSCTLTTADIVAVVESFLDKLPFYLKNSNTIKLDNFGRFKLSFSSIGQKEEGNVSASDITDLRVLLFTHIINSKSNVQVLRSKT